MRSRTRIFYVLSILLALIFGALLFWYTDWHFYWTWLLTISLVTFLLYGLDKMQAKRGGLRIPEVLLHILALAGGFPGAWLGRRIFHHKTRKQIFTVVLVASAMIHLAVTYALFIRA